MKKISNSSQADEKFLRSEIDNRVGSGRSLKLVLRSG
jgi:hypothetical protein